MPFFHGTEVEDVAELLISIAQVNGSTGVIIGTAPDGPAGMTLVNSPKDALQFGASVFDGRTIPHALDAFIAQGASQIFVINCFKPDAHLNVVEDEASAVPATFIVPLVHVPVGPIVVTTVAGSPVTLVSGTDYTYNSGDKFFTILTRRVYIATTALQTTYSYFDPTTVVTNDILGAVNGTTGERTGIKLLDLCFSRTGITPKFLVAPVYVETQTVCDALLAAAVKLRARVICDAPNPTTIANAIASRGPAGTYINWDSSDPRLVPVFPYVYKPDPLQPKAAGVAFPYSPYFAGMWAAAMNSVGIQRSPSNLTLKGIKKLVLDISCNIGDKTSDANILNSAGISTIYTGFGSGPRSWGNRSGNFPAQPGINSFLSVLIVQDILDESVLMASLVYQDLSITPALIDTIVSAVNALINTMILSKALIAGECYYDPELNTIDQLGTGYAILSYRDLPPPPGEHIKFQSLIDISLFAASGLSVN